MWRDTAGYSLSIQVVRWEHVVLLTLTHAKICYCPTNTTILSHRFYLIISHLSVSSSTSIWVWFYQATYACHIISNIIIIIIMYQNEKDFRHPLPKYLTKHYRLTTLKLYVALVRPHLEYAAQVWNPLHAKDINCQSEEICSYNNFVQKTITNLMKICWISINYHHFRIGGCFCVNVLYLLLYCYWTCVFPKWVSPSTNHGSYLQSKHNPYAYRVPQVQLNGLPFSFFANTIRQLNKKK